MTICQICGKDKPDAHGIASFGLVGLTTVACRECVPYAYIETKVK